MHKLTTNLGHCHLLQHHDNQKIGVLFIAKVASKSLLYTRITVAKVASKSLLYTRITVDVYWFHQGEPSCLKRN